MSRKEQELNFLNGLISLNKNFFYPSVSRIPKYLMSRFYDVNDHKLNINKNLRDILSFEKVLDLHQQAGEEFNYLKIKENSKILKLMSTHLNRIHNVNEEHFCSTLEFCSPWPDIKAVESSEKHKSIDGCKIYSSIGVIYRNDPKVRLVVQESEGWFGYSPDIFKAHATILFPPIEKHEVWTIGFVQGVTKNYMENSYKNGLRFV